MKPATVLTAAAAVAAPLAHAFPTPDNISRLAGLGLPHRDPEHVLRDITEGVRRARDKRLLFDPMTTPIEVTGEHEFRAPDLAAGDQRGPCPGLNALANHGYISRDGVVGLPELIAAGNHVFGMGLELVTVLAVMGTVGVGNPLSLMPGFSIGGPPPSPEASSILLGTPRGLYGAHNWIEGDASATRDDLYVTDNAWTMNMTRFVEVHDSIPADEDGAWQGADMMERIGALAVKRFGESVATNPDFYYGPYTGMVARNAAYLFIGRLLSNHSAEFPDGRMTKDVFASFFGVTVSSADAAPVYNEGHERIPANWFRTPLDYGLAPLNADLALWFLQYPVLASIGGNTGTVDSFAGLDMSDLTGGVANTTKLLEGNNIVCFALQVVKTFAPNMLGGLFALLATPVGMVGDAVGSAVLDLGCPAWRDLTVGGEGFVEGVRGAYPGAAKGFAL